MNLFNRTKTQAVVPVRPEGVQAQVTGKQVIIYEPPYRVDEQCDKAVMQSFITVAVTKALDARMALVNMTWKKTCGAFVLTEFDVAERGRKEYVALPVEHVSGVVQDFIRRYYKAKAAKLLVLEHWNMDFADSNRNFNTLLLDLANMRSQFTDDEWRFWYALIGAEVINRPEDLRSQRQGSVPTGLVAMLGDAKICPQCNLTNPPTGRYCTNCGATLA
jgi:hypothetical protein